MKTKVIMISLAMILAGCSTLPRYGQIGQIQDLGNLGPAPELTNEI
ncbi:MAG: hypothetical protein HQ574_06360 [Chloroflexi bacterium]|nr:hypothetical protein [Chloroflexota bacterium]